MTTDTTPAVGHGPTVADERPWSVDIANLSLTYAGTGGRRALDGIDLRLHPGEILAVIGETGSGKSTLIRSVLGLATPGATTEGTIRVRTAGDDTVEPLTLHRKEAAAFRRGSIGYVPQLTQRALVPMLTVAQHFEQFRSRAGALAARTRGARAEVDRIAIEALEQIGIVDGARVMTMYPHQLSGGMAQRVCIALAMFGSAGLMIADEPTSGLDAVVRRRVADLLEQEIAGTDRTMVLVTHDLALAKRLATRVAVLLRGELVEVADAGAFFDAPTHPYARHLLASIPRPGEPLPEPYVGTESA